MKKIIVLMAFIFLISTVISCETAKKTTQNPQKDHATQKIELEKSDDGGKAAEEPESPVPPAPAKEEETIPESVLIDAPMISQLPELPNGCEITSLTMLLQQAGIQIDKITLAKNMKTVPFVQNGVHGDPNEGYVGNMFHGPPGYAVYHGPVAALAKNYLGSKVIDLSGLQWSDIEKQLANHHPVWVIINTSFAKLPASQFQTWHTKNGDMQVTMHEHSVLVTGYDAQFVYFNDPLTNTKNKKANKQSFIEGWQQMGSQAISYQ
ncbi:MAG: C39 family peptidase [Tuberibacillus sp.]